MSPEDTLLVRDLRARAEFQSRRMTKGGDANALALRTAANRIEALANLVEVMGQPKRKRA